MGIEERLDQAIDDAFGDQVTAVSELVEIPSHTYATEDVEEAASRLDGMAEALGLTVATHEATDPRFAQHRVYSTPAAVGSSGAIALVGHIDTVFPRSSGFLEFSRDDERAYGPGVVDMKSGLMTILYALRALKRCDVWDDLAVHFVCVSDEEVGSPSSRDLYAQIAGGLGEALVFEHARAEDRTITSRKGGGSFELTARGRAAHAGNAHAEGVNAILALSLLVPRIEALTDYDRGITLNVGLFRGGTAKNTIPAEAHCIIDVRVVTTEDAEEVSQRIRDIVSAAEGVPAGATFELTGGITRPPMERTDANEALRERYERASTAVGLGSGPAPRQGGFSDANLLAAHGVPVIDGLGPSGGGAHSHDEWCDLESMRKRTKALARYLATRCG